MSTIDVARPSGARVTRINPRASDARGISRLWTLCATWADIVGSAFALSHALDAAPPRKRAKLAAGWLELLQARRI
jgi:hypothetical protein